MACPGPPWPFEEEEEEEAEEEERGGGGEVPNRAASEFERMFRHFSSPKPICNLKRVK